MKFLEKCKIEDITTYKLDGKPCVLFEHREEMQKWILYVFKPTITVKKYFTTKREIKKWLRTYETELVSLLRGV